MSVPLLLTAIDAHPSPLLALVSADLLAELDLAGELTTSHHPFVLPADPKYGAVIDRWLEANGIDPAAPIAAADQTLTSRPHVHVRLDADYGHTLQPAGPGSFVLR